jgi:hypothetical protein
LDIKRVFLLKECIFEFIWNHSWRNPAALTLTEKQIAGGVRIDPIRSSQNTRHFLNRLNEQVFGNASRRYGKKLQVVTVMEQDASHRHHLHMMIDRPDQISLSRFAGVVLDCWRKTAFGYNQISVRPCHDDGWIRYILKSRTKIDFLSSIDWENTHFVSQTSLN